MKDSCPTGIKSYSQQGIQGLVKDLGFPLFRARQLEQWLYQKGVSSYDEMTNLPKDMRSELSLKAPLYPSVIEDRQESFDGTRKYIVSFYDGQVAEMVAMPFSDRLSACISTQVGCAMGCAFCATGREGLVRNLLPGEMVDQVILLQRDICSRVSNVVVMGQGEPFQNYGAVLAALRFLNSKDGLNIGARRITVSTCGMVSGIERFAHEPEQFTLAVSLHSAVQETRDLLMPRMAGQPLGVLHAALEKYQSTAKRRVSLEYLLVKGLNDDDAHLGALQGFCQGLSCHVNLIPLNAVEGSPLRPASGQSLRRFADRLSSSGIETTVRHSRGSDIAGGCGQLKNRRAVRQGRGAAGAGCNNPVA